MSHRAGTHSVLNLLGCSDELTFLAAAWHSEVWNVSNLRGHFIVTRSRREELAASTDTRSFARAKSEAGCRELELFARVHVSARSRNLQLATELVLKLDSHRKTWVLRLGWREVGVVVATAGS